MNGRKLGHVAAIVGLVAASSVVTGALVASAASRPTRFYACLKGGELSKVSESPQSCGSGHREIYWNQVGPPGPRGIPGPRGAGAQSTYAHLAPGTGVGIQLLRLTAGTWSVSYEVTSEGGECALHNDTNLTVLDENDTPGTGTWDVGTAYVSVTSGVATLALQCTQTISAGMHISMTATPTTIQ